MTSNSNVFSVKDNNEKKNKKYNIGPSPSLNQGKKFKKYQNKIESNLEEKAILLSGKEGFTHMSEEGITAKTNEIINNNDYSNQRDIINNLRDEYQKTLNEYKALTSKMSQGVDQYINRVSSNNPYLNKTIRFTTGHVCYVTNQGVVKYIPTTEIWNSVNVPKDYIDIGIPWQESYSTPGTIISSNPTLISGTFMQNGQSVGGEGTNVFVNQLISNPETNYIGCYNKNPPITEILFVPVMNPSNSVNGYISRASSIYQGNNNFAGPWAAFDRNSNDFWHSEVSSSTNYNGSTGEYTGINGWDYNDANGNNVRASGEWLWIECPPGNVLIKYEIQGRQGCCGDPSGRSPNSWVIIGGVYNQTYELIDKRDNEELNFEKKTYIINNSKKYNHFIFLTTNCGNPGDRTGNRYCVQIAQWNLYTTSNFTDSNVSPTMSNIGSMTFEQCKIMALNTGNKYFSLNNPDESRVGTCSVGNDLAQIQQYGQSYEYNEIPLWDTKTNSVGTTATLTNTGSLSVMNSGGQSVFASPNSENGQLSSYIGCYGDSGDRAMNNTSNNQYLPLEQCKQLAIDQNYKYYGIQDAHGGDNGWCVGSNDLSAAKRYGLASNCTTNSGGFIVGGGWSNAIYSVNPGGNYFLILQDDGNMCIYKGSGPSDNQGAIWCSNTNGQQRESNTTKKADKSRFGRNYLLTGEQLLPNEFLGSNDGSIYLLMQTDGNLVLYTSTSSLSCSTKYGKDVGSENGNAIYEIKQYGNQSNLGKLGYVDADSVLYDYPAGNKQYTNTYSTMYKDLDTYGNDIPGAAFGNSSVDSCMTTCNNNPECSGFVIDVGGNYNKTCFPKTNQMFPYGGPTRILDGIDLYIRDNIPSSLPIGVSKDTKNIDSIKFQNYINKGAIGNKYGLANATSAQREELEQLQSRMNILSSQINNLTGKFSAGSNIVEEQSENNVSSIDNYLTVLKKTNQKMMGIAENSTTNNILNDSDIVVLQKNYEYLFWSILAAGTVLVSMNIIKK